MSTLGVSLGERFGCVLWGLVLRKKQSVQILRQLEDIRWVIIIYYDLPSQTVTLRLWCLPLLCYYFERTSCAHSKWTFSISILGVMVGIRTGAALSFGFFALIWDPFHLLVNLALIDIFLRGRLTAASLWSHILARWRSTVFFSRNEGTLTLWLWNLLRMRVWLGIRKFICLNYWGDCSIITILLEEILGVCLWLGCRR